ncbi:MAG: tRNA (guanosine(37)-N1)-methyltransferase TrmD [Dehalococcoidia bacterium]|nr:tRNA (guanosine(37)-N1)-methyltransferase TrmD [Dehalococcoidia bacterium]
MRIDILTLFPGMFEGPFNESIIRRGIDRGLLEIHVHNLRDWGLGKHKVVDDYPFGGGTGMVVRPEPVFEATEAIQALADTSGAVVLLTPQGKVFDQSTALKFSEYSRIILICGHYEGIDERVREHLITDEISIGDYVLTGGELPAMVVVDAVARLLPGVLGSESSAREDSHTRGLLEYPHYTRPQSFRGWEVPDVLLSGNHALIAKWRKEQSILRTLSRRPDLIEKADLTPDERELMARLKPESDKENESALPTCGHAQS